MFFVLAKIRMQASDISEIQKLFSPERSNDAEIPSSTYLSLYHLILKSRNLKGEDVSGTIMHDLGPLLSEQNE